MKRAAEARGGGGRDDDADYREMLEGEPISAVGPRWTIHRKEHVEARRRGPRVLEAAMWILGDR